MPELTVGVDNNCLRRPAIVHATNAGDKCGRLCPLLADADFVGVARHTGVADINVVAAGGEISPGTVPKAMLNEAGRVV